MPSNTKKNTLSLNKAFFWDTDLNKIDVDRNRKFIVSRILDRGDWPDFKALIDNYSKEQVKDDILHLRYMDRKSLRFCSFYSRISEEEFRCFNTML